MDMFFLKGANPGKTSVLLSALCSVSMDSDPSGQIWNAGYGLQIRRFYPVTVAECRVEVVRWHGFHTSTDILKTSLFFVFRRQTP
jgi:hypothetical protein